MCEGHPVPVEHLLQDVPGFRPTLPNQGLHLTPYSLQDHGQPLTAQWRHVLRKMPSNHLGSIFLHGQFSQQCVVTNSRTLPAAMASARGCIPST